LTSIKLFICTNVISHGLSAYHHSMSFVNCFVLQHGEYAGF
jgi:hypothetical protein